MLLLFIRISINNTNKTVLIYWYPHQSPTSFAKKTRFKSNYQFQATLLFRVFVTSHKSELLLHKMIRGRSSATSARQVSGHSLSVLGWCQEKFMIEFDRVQRSVLVL